MTRRAIRVAAALAGIAVLARSGPAAAYRPFDGTDAAIADPGELSVEIGPLQYLRQGPDRLLEAPAVTLSYGFAPTWQAVIGGTAVHGLTPGVPRHALEGADLVLTHVLREGSMQHKEGPSLATEFGFLLPGIGTQPGLGGSVAAIASEEWPWGRLHGTVRGAATRDGHADLFLSAILEGPPAWPVRPVAELVHDRDFGQSRSFSALVGAIWQVSEKLAFDLALRGARLNDHTAGELRAGLTIALPLH